MTNALTTLGRAARAVLTLAAVIAIPVALLAYGPGLPSGAQLKVAYDLHWVSSHLAAQLATGVAVAAWAYLAGWLVIEVVATRRGGGGRAPRWLRPVVMKLAAILLMASLRLPVGAPMALASTATPAPVAKVSQATQAPSALVQHHRVVAGDNLWDLAHEYYGNGLHWKVIWDANFSVDPDPDLILPGQMLVIPPLPSTQAAPPAPASPNGSQSAPATASGPPPVAAPTPAAPVRPAGPMVPGGRTRPLAPAVIRGPSQTTGAPRLAGPPPRAMAKSARANGNRAGSQELVFAELALGTLAAAGIIRALMVLRRRQRNRCPLDRRVPQPGPALVPTEVALRRAASPESLERMEAALGALAAGLADRPGELPTVLGVVVSADGAVRVCVDRHQAAAPKPFKVADDGKAWELAAATRVDQGLADTESVLPALVSVGRTPGDEEVLVNLEAFGCVSLVGPGAGDLLRAWVTELATKSWAQCIEVVSVGFGEDLASLDRLRPAEALDDEVVRAMVAQAEEVTRMVDDLGEGSLLAARLRGDPENWAPQVVCCAQAPSREALAPLRVALAESTRSGVVLAGAGPMPEAALVLDTATEEMKVAPLGVVVRPHRLAETEAASLGSLMEVAKRTDVVGPEDPAYAETTRDLLDPAIFFEPEDQEHPPRSNGSAGEATPKMNGDHGQDPLAEGRQLAAQVLDDSRLFEDPVDGHGQGDAGGSGPEGNAMVGPERPRRAPAEPGGIEVAVLGPVEAHGVASELQGKAKEMAAYVALHPEGVNKRRLMRVLWPNHPGNPEKTFHNTVSEVRKAFGLDKAGNPYFLRSTASTYKFSGVGTDWARFLTLVAQAGKARDEQARGYLYEALSRVRGEPFSGERGYEWISGPLAVEDGFFFDAMTAAIAEAASALADTCLACDDRPGAAWALDQGLLACPADERLVALRMAVADGPAEVAGALEELRRRSDDDLGDEVLTRYRELCSQDS